MSFIDQFLEFELNTTGGTFSYTEGTSAEIVPLDSDDSANGLTILYGIFVVLTGAFCFGTMHVPIRRYAQENDGIFVQWVMSFGSLLIGFIVNMVMGSPQVQLLATGGGVLWTFANSIAQFVISGLGLAPALLLWSTTNILTGWSAGRFGLFGLRKKSPEHAVLNAVGLVTIISGGICFAFIKKSLLPVSNKQAHVYPRTRSLRSSTGLFDAEEGKHGGEDGGKEDGDDVFDQGHDDRQRQNRLQNPHHHHQPQLQQQQQQSNLQAAAVKRKTSLEHPSFLLSVPQIMVTTEESEERRKQQRLQFSCADSSTSNNELMEEQSRSKRFRKWMMRNSHRLLCICLALISGFFYAATVIPVLYIQDNPDKFPGTPHSGLNYIFSHYFGIFLGATGIFVTYALLKRNKPTVNPQVILPSLVSGAIWGCGMVCLFLANDLLTQTVTYPVLITIPGCVASIWSIFYFREIKMNRRNRTIMSIAFSLIFSGAFMVFLSKSKVHFDGAWLSFAR